MRQPDGFIQRYPSGAWDHETFLDYVDGDDPDDQHGGPYHPVCLVPPELLDWVEEMRRQLKCFYEWAGSGPETEWIEDDLSRLNQILPEGK